MSILLSPSLLSANFADLGAEVRALREAGITWLHLDVMDGAYVPNITFGPSLIKSLRVISPLFFDTHLMIEAPERYIDAFAAAGADLVVAHLETMSHPQKTLAMIRDQGMKAGLALNPGTDISLARWLLPYIDMILVMGVNPGFSGQNFIPETVSKIRFCREWLAAHDRPDMPIQVDGGVSRANAAMLVEAGADILVSGSAFFGQKDYKKAARDFAIAVADCQPGPGLSVASGWKSQFADAFHMD